MKINKTLPESNSNSKQIENNKKEVPQQVSYSPSFRAGGFTGALNFFGSAMQKIEDGGFLASFLIQDMLGMTAPRVGAAFLRDKDVTGKYNTQEGFEVLGREGLTGPCMMAVAPVTFAIAARFGRSTGVNSRLIKRFGNSLKEMIRKPDFDKSLLTNKDKFKKEFYITNIREMLENTLGKENVKEESITFILEKIAKYEKIPTDAVLPKNLIGIKSKSKYRKQLLSEIADHINNIKYSTSSELGMLDNLNVGSRLLKNDIKPFSTRDTIEAMIKYSDDAITMNKNLKQLDDIMAEDLKNSSIAKRFMANIATIASTLGVLSVLPKIYIRSNVSPGARTAMQLKEAKLANSKDEHNVDNKDDAENRSQEVSFKAGKKPNKSWLSKLGKKLAKFFDKDFAGSELEYNGHNFTNTLMAGLSLFGLLAPRGFRAYNRAQVDENGKKDLTELYEILIRDISSSLAVVFAVPMLTRAAVTAYENKSGFVLLQKDRSKSKLATAFDLLNPYSKAHVLTNTEINSLYNNIDSKEKMLNFCKYIDNNGGDLQKIIAKSEEANLIFNDKNIKLSELANLSKKEKNKKIVAFIEGLGKDGRLDKKAVDKLIADIMKHTAKPKANNKILGFARGLNSIPGVITTFLISPYLLGWFIPRLTYANTRRLHEKAEQEKQQKQQKINTAA